MAETTATPVVTDGVHRCARCGDEVPRSPTGGLRYSGLWCSSECRDKAIHPPAKPKDWVNQNESDAEVARELLLWARASRFRVRELQLGVLRLVLDDLGDELPPEKLGPSSAHEAFARELGLDYSEDDDGPDPVEGQG